MNEKEMGASEIYLAPQTEVFDQAAEIAQTTVADTKYPFVLEYDLNEKEYLLSVLNAAGAVVTEENDSANSMTVSMNMSQLRLIKSLDCITRVKTDEGKSMRRAAFDAPQMNNKAVATAAAEAQVMTLANDEVMVANEVNVASADDGIAVACVSGCTTGNNTKETALEIPVEKVVNGCICCPGAEQWFKFTVPEEKNYTIFTKGSLDTVGQVFNEEETQIGEGDDNEANGSLNFRIRCTLKPGNTYYVKVTTKHEDTGSYGLKVTENILVDNVIVTPPTIVLEAGKTYELPLSAWYTFLSPDNAESLNMLSVDVYPSDATEKRVFWVSFNSDIIQVSGQWYEQKRVWTVKAVEVGHAQLYAYDWNEMGRRAKINVVVVKPGSYYNIVNKITGKVANISGNYLLNLSDGKDIIPYSKSGSNEQIWLIDTISYNEDCYIRSYINQEYGFNAYRYTSDNDEYNYNCNLHKIAGNETDAAVHFVLQKDGSYKIKLANYSNYYLTEIDSGDHFDIRWQPEDGEKNQNWELVNFDIAQHEAEKKEYHIVPHSDINLPKKQALQVDMNTPNDGDEVNKTIRLANDEPLELADFSYINKQKWLIKGTGSACKIYTPHGDDYCLCKKNDTKVYVSNNSSYESNVTIVVDDISDNLIKIKLSNSNLYLTLSDAGIVWASLASDSNNQRWQLVEKPNNIHNGADTRDPLYDGNASDKDRTVRAYKLGGENFVIRYYAKPENNSKILTDTEVNAFRDYGINIVSVYQDVGDKEEYFSSEYGTQNATRALELANSLGQPHGSAIYFAVDYDAKDLNNIRDYFSAIKKVFDENGNKYQIGVYGSGKVCIAIQQLYAQYSWLNCATGHADYDDYDSPSKYNIKQAESIKYDKTKFDDCIAVGDDYGQWYK